ncbi:uncharacterized protein Z519_11960 [Cladophialophora bantiana CBS 173.52]|uniref:2EXR domain-containing protein n=1 Tax=Cladophialophora bantiana (strain ATCC 10958 / CBS 173.52 / CDC B-1940 / NIH 8579) TaxID=1442370 RepID=A0A0D2HSG1_CLAB1|nr:uncharacterized protein Z519_11960 [Cladophialophora bantiana CBS 173.52]KIW87324.1 hypothetical protein Z519_11960 [Cladophialophora bantiana CBS 173.52]
MTNFLNLPPELRQNIYDFSLPVQQLKAQDFYDPAWSDAEKPAGIPSLFFVNKAVSEEAAAAFYSRAVLNVAPLRPAPYLFDSLTSNGPKLNLAFGLDVEFSSCPRRHLQRITTARIYSGQHDAISAEAYEALLRWLVDNTAVQMIHLSRRLMTRLRRARADINATFDLRAAAPSLSLLRTIYVYSAYDRSPWEVTRMHGLEQVLGETRLPGIQVYVLEKGGQNDALLDPRWDARRSDDNQRRDMMHNISGWLDSLLAGDPAAEQKGRAEDEPRLYQVCFVFQRSQPRTG